MGWISYAANAAYDSMSVASDTQFMQTFGISESLPHRGTLNVDCFREQYILNC